MRSAWRGVVSVLVSAVLVCVSSVPASAASSGRAVARVEVSSSRAVLAKGKTVKLEASITPAGAAKASVTWSSSDTGVATVNSEGTVTAKRAGTAVVTATANSGRKDSCEVVVTGYVDASAAYKQLNGFRTKKRVWYWKKGSTSKKRFNKAGCAKLGKLAKNSSLVATAKKRAKEQAKAFGHTRPNGSRCFTAYPSSLSCKGENVACGYTSAGSTVRAWKEGHKKYSGQGHRRNMLDADYEYVGVAGYVASDGVTYWCMALGG